MRPRDLVPLAIVAVLVACTGQIRTPTPTATLLPELQKYLDAITTQEAITTRVAVEVAASSTRSAVAAAATRALAWSNKEACEGRDGFFASIEGLNEERDELLKDWNRWMVYADEQDLHLPAEERARRYRDFTERFGQLSDEAYALNPPPIACEAWVRFMASVKQMQCASMNFEAFALTGDSILRAQGRECVAMAGLSWELYTYDLQGAAAVCAIFE